MKCSNKKYKLLKNYEYLKQKAINDYVICESINSVEKVIDSEQKVLNELDRISREAIFLADLKVIHIMRSKSRLMPLPPVITTSDYEKTEKVPILSEFSTQLPHNKQLPTRKELKESATNAIIDEQLEKFNQFIEQRKAYIRLLEQYLDLVETIEIEKLPIVSRLETFV